MEDSPKYMIVVGVLILLVTLYQLLREEADTMWLWDWWIDVSRWEHPLIYWALILIQGTLGVLSIWWGCRQLGLVPGL